MGCSLMLRQSALSRSTGYSQCQARTSHEGVSDHWDFTSTVTPLNGSDHAIHYLGMRPGKPVAPFRRRGAGIPSNHGGERLHWRRRIRPSPVVKRLDTADPERRPGNRPASLPDTVLKMPPLGRPPPVWRPLALRLASPAR